MSERKSYMTDLCNEQWASVEPVITAWKGAHPSVSGHRDRYAMREIVNALLYQGRTGRQANERLSSGSSVRLTVLAFGSDRGHRQRERDTRNANLHGPFGRVQGLAVGVGDRPRDLLLLPLPHGVSDIGASASCRCPAVCLDRSRPPGL
ncbi:transposase [Streptomyces mirabilis]